MALAIALASILIFIGLMYIGDSIKTVALKVTVRNQLEDSRNATLVNIERHLKKMVGEK